MYNSILEMSYSRYSQLYLCILVYVYKKSAIPTKLIYPLDFLLQVPVLQKQIILKFRKRLLQQKLERKCTFDDNWYTTGV